MKKQKDRRMNIYELQLNRKLCKLIGCVFLFLFFVTTMMSYLNLGGQVKDKTIKAMQAVMNDESGMIFKGPKFVHIDLKGAPPKISYFDKIFPLFKKMGADGVLIEYEDMFPYSEELKDIPALNAYSLDDIKVINTIAKENGLKIIPLIQTFGHLEFVLKLQQYRELREVNGSAQSICPTNDKTLPLLSIMVEQILQAHPTSDTIHIGCDEVRNLATCPRCYNTLMRKEWTQHHIFLNHVKSVAEIVHNIRPDMKVFIWDDMLRKIELDVLIYSGINKHVIPVAWSYLEYIYDEIDPATWKKYQMFFPGIWVASAFKGATKSNELVTDVKYYVNNHKSWLHAVEHNKNSLMIGGIIITGWQRYDHFAVLCDILPVAIPSLGMCLGVLSGKPATYEVENVLKCNNPFALAKYDLKNAGCQYPGSEILEGVLNLKRLKDSYLKIMQSSFIMGWMSDFNVEYTFSNPAYVEEGTQDLGTMKMELTLIENLIVSNMYDIYDNYTIKEWTQLNIQPLEQKIIDLWEKKERLLSRDVWPRRPINEM